MIISFKTYFGLAAKISLGTFAAIVGALCQAAEPAGMQFMATNHVPEFLPEYTDVFYGKKPRIYLDGEWQARLFRCEQRDYKGALAENASCFQDPPADAAGDWNSIQVPGFMDAPYGSDNIGAVFLTRQFTVPAGAAGRRLILHFTGIGWSPAVYVNGRKAAEYESLMPGWPTEYFQTDITDMTRPGANRITVALFKFRKTLRLFSSGIYAPVYIDLAEPVYASEMRIIPRLPDTIRVRASVVNTTGRALSGNLRAVVTHWRGGGPAATLNLDDATWQPGTNAVEFEVRISDPVLWDVDNPHLYSLQLLAGDMTVGWERFGLREFKVAGRDFLLNGRKFNCLGIAAEEGNLARLMYVENTNPQFMNNGGDCLRRYLALLKEHNCNSIMRWPVFTQALNDLADEIGLLQFHMFLPWKMYNEDFPLSAQRRLADQRRAVPEYFSKGFFYERAPGRGAGDIPAGRTPDELAAAGVLRRCPPDIYDPAGRDGFLREAFDKLGRSLCNHPSVVAIVAGDENFGDINQAFDMPAQKAALQAACPGMLFSAGHSYGETSLDLAGKSVNCSRMLDCLDFANPAAGGIGGSYMRFCHWAMFAKSLRNFTEDLVYRRVGRELPVFADETLYYGVLRQVARAKFWRFFPELAGNIFPGGTLDAARMAAALGEPKIEVAYAIENIRERVKYLTSEQIKAGDAGLAWLMVRPHLQLMGLTPDLGDRGALIAAVAGRVKKMVEPIRIHGEYMQGVGGVAGPWLEYDLERLARLDAAGIRGAAAIGRMFQHVYAPVYAALDFYGQRSSMQAGAVWQTDLHLFNNSRADLADLETSITLSGVAGELALAETACAALPAGARISLPVSLAFPADCPAGDCRINLVLTADGRAIASNYYELYMHNAAAEPAIAAPGPIQVYPAADAAARAAFRQLLEGLRLPVEEIPRAQLAGRLAAKPRYVIVAPRALDGASAGELAALRPWLEQGGQLLCLEQDYAGKLPWAPEIAAIRLRHRRDFALPAVGIDALPVRYADPLFDGLAARKYWESFNNPDGEMYRYLLGPLTAEARVIGADLGRLEDVPVFGALVLDRKIVAGRCLISQIEAVKALEFQDGAARRYLVNLFRAWLDSD